MSERTVAITGSTGFLGRAVVERARAERLTVKSLLRSDLQTVRTTAEAMGGAGVVIHAAGRAHVFGAEARNAELFDEANAERARISAAGAVASGAGHFILISSVAVYGPHAAILVDENHRCRPDTPYSRSKLRGEMLVHAETRDRIKVTVLRMATIYGEGDRGNTGRLIRAIEQRRFVQIGSGRNRKSLIHRQDAASACLKAIERSGSSFETFNVVGGIHRVRDIVDAIVTATGRPVIRVPMPESAVAIPASAIRKLFGDTMPGRAALALQKWIADDAYDGSRFERASGFRAGVSLREGIVRQVEAR